MKSFLVYLGESCYILAVAKNFKHVYDMMNILGIEYNCVLEDTEDGDMNFGMIQFDNICKN